MPVFLGVNEPVVAKITGFGTYFDYHIIKSRIWKE